MLSKASETSRQQNAASQQTPVIKQSLVPTQDPRKRSDNGSTSRQEDKKISKCTAQSCVDGGQVTTMSKLRCQNCQREVHYSCTHLPSYQIALFLSKDYAQYRCMNCVRVNRSLSKALSTKGLESEEVTQLRLQNENFKRERDALNSEIKNLNNRISANKVKTTTPELEKLEREVKACENLLKNSEDTKMKLKENINNLQFEIQRLTEENARYLETHEQKSKIEEKVSQLISQLKSFSTQNPSCENGTLTYAEATKKQPPENYSIEAKNYELYSQKHDERKRELNIIIHGAKEQRHPNTDRSWYNDQALVKNICFQIEEKSWEFKQVYRIGKYSGEKPRPIKVIFQTIKEKSFIMENLSKLKGVTEFIGIGITHDYTKVERALLQEWKMKAERKSEQHDKSIWKVRGNPKEGLYLKRFFVRKSRKIQKDGQVNESHKEVASTQQTNERFLEAENCLRICKS